MQKFSFSLSLGQVCRCLDSFQTVKHLKVRLYFSTFRKTNGPIVVEGRAIEFTQFSVVTEFSWQELCNFPL